jgi:hypothetical protein
MMVLWLINLKSFLELEKILNELGKILNKLGKILNKLGKNICYFNHQ